MNKCGSMPISFSHEETRCILFTSSSSLPFAMLCSVFHCNRFYRCLPSVAPSFSIHFISCPASCILTVEFKRRELFRFADEFFQTKSSYALNGFGNFRSFYRYEDGQFLLLQLYHRLCSGLPMLRPRSYHSYEKIRQRQ